MSMAADKIEGVEDFSRLLWRNYGLLDVISLALCL